MVMAVTGPGGTYYYHFAEGHGNMSYTTYVYTYRSGLSLTLARWLLDSGQELIKRLNGSKLRRGLVGAQS